MQKFTHMIKNFRVIPVLGLFLLGSCGVPESLEGFDSETWKSDRYSCENKRAALLDDFEKIKKELYGKKEYVLRNLLGKPDSEELLAGNQRIYYYYIEQGAQCVDNKQLSDANRIEIRLTAVGKISEVGYYRPVTAK
ncbi:hypothetical protein [Pontibacter akesuensis]|nr:hypothetical protein [Pontibacter akesuensis]GHA60156.1 hypothetical protein GCM10007389_10470 [Pontibacter akesuensis]